jgi:hypothetical protein
LAIIKSDKRRTVRRRHVRLEIVSSAAGFLLRAGPVSLLLDREAAEELMLLLADALEPSDPLGIARTGSN